jgi:hypothetical protein
MAGQAALPVRLDRAEADIARVDRAEADIARVASEVGELRSRVESKTSQIEWKVREMPAKVRQVDLKVTQVESKVTSLGLKMSQLNSKAHQLNPFIPRSNSCGLRSALFRIGQTYAIRSLSLTFHGCLKSSTRSDGHCTIKDQLFVTFWRAINVINVGCTFEN